MPQFEFVLADTSSGKVSKTERTFVRSRCMQGKNKKENSRRSIRAARRAAKETLETNSSDASVKDNEANSRHPGSLADRTVNPSWEPGGVVGSRARVVESQARPVPEQRAVEPSLDGEMIRFIHQDTHLYPRNVLYSWSTLQHIKTIAFPVYNYLRFFDIPDNRDEYAMVIQDDALQAGIQLMISAFKDLSQGLPYRAETFKHYGATVALLKVRFGELGGANTESTVHVIASLAMVAVWSSRPDEAHTHLIAVRRVVQMCGGRKFLQSRPTMLYRMQCIELIEYLCTGKTAIPNVLDDSKTDADKSNSLARLLLQTPSNALEEPISSLLDPRLVYLLEDFRFSAYNISNHWAEGQPLECGVFQPFFNSILSRLLDLRKSLPDVLSECLRLGLLSFLAATLLNVPHRRVKGLNPYNYLTECLRNSLRAVEPSPELSLLLFWILTVACMGVFDAKDAFWLDDKWQSAATWLGVQSWDDARTHLNRVVWIDVVHDEAGHKVFEQLWARRKQS